MCVGEEDAILTDRLIIDDPVGGSSSLSAFSDLPTLLWQILLLIRPTFPDAGGMYE